MADAPVPRVLDFHGIHNFRDYGDYPVRGGGRIKAGLLWRSGQHVDATSDDLARVADLGLATIIDLRGDTERRLHPCARPLGFAADVLFAPGETAGDGGAAPHQQAAAGVRTGAEAHAAMVRLYAAMPFRPNLIAVYRLYFAALAEDRGPSLLHCLAGKDRTGVAAGILHHLLGVHEDDVMADYLLTNSAGNLERRIAAGAVTVRGNFGQDMDDEALRTIMSVHPEFLDTAFAAIRERHGDIGSYARDVLGVTSEMERRLKSALLQ